MNRQSPFGSLLAYCRAGFETECARELIERARELRIELEGEPASSSAFVVLHCRPEQAIESLRAKLRFDTLTFARQLVYAGAPVLGMSSDDRITPLLDAAKLLAPRCSAIVLETADTNEAKQLSSLCRALAPKLIASAKTAGLLAEEQPSLPRLHVFFLDSHSAYLAVSDARNGSPWPQGIPRVRLPHGAPSRASAKLAEAFMIFLGDEDEALVKPGLRAVDLGAAPGGWTWTLINRGLRVIAVDNGPLKGDLNDNALVEHLRVDAFRYRPRRPVDWLTCDVAAPPARVARLVSDWIAEGAARQAIFNLKLPMKKRYDEVAHCAALMREQLDTTALRYELRFKQLYHDREEITGFCRVLPRRRR